MGKACSSCNCYTHDEVATEFKYPVFLIYSHNFLQSNRSPPVKEAKKEQITGKDLQLEIKQTESPSSKNDFNVNARNDVNIKSPEKNSELVEDKSSFKKSGTTDEITKEESGPKSIRIENPGLTENPVAIPDMIDTIMVENQKLDNGEIFTGTIKKGKRSGKGTMVWPNGDKYVGEWENDLFEGQGTFSQQSGEVYEGYWKAGKLNGHGKVMYPNGYYLEAEFINDVANGIGKEIDVDNRRYEGMFKDGKKNGQGKMTWKDGKVYEGEFSDNQMHGKGKMIRSDGSVYEGDFVKGKQEGQGEYTWKDGRKYVGNFTNGKQHGIGEFTSATGEKKKGRWENGKRVAWIDENGNDIKSSTIKDEKSP